MRNLESEWLAEELRGLEFAVVGHEGDFKWLIGVVHSEIEAKKLAERNVDDATRNPIFVYQNKGDANWIPLGYAYFGGDGGTYWSPTRG